MNSKQSELIEKYQESKLLSNNNIDETPVSDDEDDLLDQLEREEEEIFSKYRESRIQELSKEIKNVNSSVTQSINNELGELKTIQNEKELMEILQQNSSAQLQGPPIVIHFQQPEFAKCKIMNERLNILAEKHLGLKIYNINAVDAPFLVTKLGIKVLPFVVGYIKGAEVLRVVGFEKLGNNPETFDIETLEQLFYMHGLINRKTINFGSIKQKSKILTEDSDDDLDL
ncbi:phosducin-like protein 1 [[Candida] railenensis]|uniref:Phosducin-like protein 1 n=1 Tax=[Candida] railenensis TaxID=45579 RepID=A0A9P0W0A8_9ASCO|nr:phosducin-like protein 1 [[Candida] railenensis]